MTDHDKKISGVEAPLNPVQQSAPSEGRRRLMKGALAAPAVMTLMHGRLAAAASISCDLKLEGTAQPDWIVQLESGAARRLHQEDGVGPLGYDNEDGEFVPYDGRTAISPSCWASLTNQVQYNNL